MVKSSKETATTDPFLIVLTYFVFYSVKHLHLCEQIHSFIHIPFSNDQRTNKQNSVNNMI